jgi:hypothetical protein
VQQPLTLAALKSAARLYATEISAQEIPELYGVTDGKAVGTFVEAGFNVYISRHYVHEAGNAAKGIDFPSLNVDLKVTSIRQPQSSCPFRDATQKVYGLGYHLLLMVYEKTDSPEPRTSRLNVVHVVFIDETATADFQTTTGLRLLLDANANVDDVDAFLQDRNLPVDDIARRDLALRILTQPPAIGALTISNALQWRLQYGRAIEAVRQPTPRDGLEDLLA